MSRFKYVTLYAFPPKEWDEGYGVETPQIRYRRGQYNHHVYPCKVLSARGDEHHNPPELPDEATDWDGWIHTGSTWWQEERYDVIREEMQKFESELSMDCEFEYIVDSAMTGISIRR